MKEKLFSTSFTNPFIYGTVITQNRIGIFKVILPDPSLNT